MGEGRTVEINTCINSKIYTMIKGDKSYGGVKARWVGGDLYFKIE